jgi:TPP-dependent pyruvate/acetoin dehydrogenase alpha subunit
MELSNDQLTDMYRTMVTIRRFEERVAELFTAAKLRGSVHVYIGEEAVATGACSALRETDYITSTHRGHGHCIAKGGQLPRMMAEIYGRATGYCKGKGGSMHIADIEAGILGANGIVGAGIPIAVGAALACSVKGLDRVVLSFFGDGAANTGSFHEAINLASVLKAPVIFLCENNQWAVSTPVSYSLPIPSVADRAAAYGILGEVVDGSDVLAVHAAVSEAAERARAGQGPTLIEAQTYRWGGHYQGDPERYRSRSEVELMRREHDPIVLYSARLQARDVLTSEQAAAIDAQVQTEVEEAVRFAESSPEPEPSLLFEDLYA